MWTAIGIFGLVGGIFIAGHRLGRLDFENEKLKEENEELKEHILKNLKV